MKNEYVIEGNVVKIFFRKANKYFLIDKEDLEKVSQFTWYLNVTGYVCTKNKDKKHLTCHSLVMGKRPNDLVIDHINRNKLDNRKCNLHFCTVRENNLNKDSYHRKENFGIHFRKGKHRNSYRVDIHDKDNKTIYIGSYRTLEKAREARNLAFLLVDKGELTPFQINKLRK